MDFRANRKWGRDEKRVLDEQEVVHKDGIDVEGHVDVVEIQDTSKGHVEILKIRVENRTTKTKKNKKNRKKIKSKNKIMIYSSPC